MQRAQDTDTLFSVVLPSSGSLQVPCDVHMARRPNLSQARRVTRKSQDVALQNRVVHMNHIPSHTRLCPSTNVATGSKMMMVVYWLYICTMTMLIGLIEED